MPCLNEAANLPELLRRLQLAFPPDGRTRAEFIVVDDGSDDDTNAVLGRLRTGEPRLVTVSRPLPGGQTRALGDGLAIARGEFVAHLDGDLQNDPADLPEMLALARTGVDAVVGFRQHRQDGLSRRWASRFANVVRRSVLRDHVQDIGCSTRVVRRDALLAMPSARNLHRYLPALLERGGFNMVQVPVHHHPRTAGRSKYGNWKRGLEGARDLLLMARLAATLSKRREKRTHVA